MRIVLASIGVVIATTLAAQSVFLPHRRKAFQASTKSAFSDNFNRSDSDSLGSNWTEIAGDTDIVSNEANSPITFDFTHRAIAYTGTACTTVGQYVKADLTGAANQRPGVIFRYTDGSSAHYELQFDDNNNVVRWLRFATPGGSSTEIAISALTVSFPMTVGLTITGTGNSTEVRVWVSPPTNTPGSGSASDWGGDTTPDVTFTDDPATAVDTGNYVGLGGSNSSGGALIYDNFYGGDW